MSESDNFKDLTPLTPEESKRKKSTKKDLDNLEKEVAERSSVTSPAARRMFGRSTNERVVEMCNKIEDLIEKAYTDCIEDTKKINIYGFSSLASNFIKLIEVSRELELGTQEGIDIHEIIAYAPNDLKLQFQNTWMKLVENYAKIKGISIEEVLKIKKEE